MTDLVIWRDIGFAATFEPSAEGYFCDWRVYRIAQIAPDGAPQYEADYDGGKSTPDLSAAVVFVEGNTKWDGCSNIRFGDPVCIHTCGRTGVRGIESIGAMLARLYRAAAERIPNRDETEMQLDTETPQ